MKKLLLCFGASFVTLFASGGLLEVEWPVEDKNQTLMQKAYPPKLIEQLSEVTLPVYLPSTYIYDQTMSIIAEENYYTITVYMDGARLMITGDRTYQESVASADKDFKAMMKSTSVEFFNAEGMMMTDFNRYGVNYSLVVECDQPENDQRCREDHFIKNAYNTLTIVGGKR